MARSHRTSHLPLPEDAPGPRDLEAGLIPLTRLLISLLLAGCLPASALGQEGAPAGAQVWVNLNSNIYHCPGTQHYGSTARGIYLPESDARDRGYRPRGNRPCGPLTAHRGAHEGGASAPAHVLQDEIGSTAVEPTTPSGPTEECVLSRIVDGDTIECETQGEVRLIGIDTPEGDQQPYGDAATAGLSSLVPGSAVVTLELDQDRRDRYRRLLAYAWYEGRMLNWLLVRQGWAVTREYVPNTQYAAEFRAAESAAAHELRGLWRIDGFRCRPADHRKGWC